MRKTLVLISTLFVLAVLMSSQAEAQRKVKLGKVCGNPKAACQGGQNFQPNDLPFEMGRNFVIGESVWFYGIVLKSAKLKNYADCEHALFSETERLEAQALFPNNKVFTLNCLDAGANFYKGVADDTGFMAVYAGPTKAAADAFLKRVKATGKFPGLNVRRMQIGINGT